MRTYVLVLLDFGENFATPDIEFKHTSLLGCQPPASRPVSISYAVPVGVPTYRDVGMYATSASEATNVCIAVVRRPVQRSFKHRQKRGAQRNRIPVGRFPIGRRLYADRRTGSRLRGFYM